MIVEMVFSFFLMFNPHFCILCQVIGRLKGMSLKFIIISKIVKTRPYLKCIFIIFTYQQRNS